MELVQGVLQRQQWIVCGLCGLTSRFETPEQLRAAIEHVMAHATLPADALPEKPGARC